MSCTSPFKLVNFVEIINIMIIYKITNSINGKVKSAWLLNGQEINIDNYNPVSTILGSEE